MRETNEVEPEIIELAKHFRGSHRLPERFLKVPWAPRTTILIYLHLNRVYDKMSPALAAETVAVAKVTKLHTSTNPPFLLLIFLFDFSHIYEKNIYIQFFPHIQKLT